MTLANLSTQILGIRSIDSSHAAVTASFAMTDFGIPLTGSMSAGFTIGFVKGLYEDEKKKYGFH